MGPTPSPARGRRRSRAEMGRGAMVVAALLAGGHGAMAQCADFAPLTLSTSCGGLCGDLQLCLAFNASSCVASTCVADVNASCAFECLAAASDGVNSEETSQGDEFTFLVTFGAYQSAQELAERTSDGAAFAAAVAALSNDTDEFPSASNDDVSVIGEIELADSVTHFTLVGGPSATESVKHKVARVGFGSDGISNSTNVSTVTLRNLALTDGALEQLPLVLPLTLTNLTLANGLLDSFPSLVANFTSMTALNLDMNDITGIAGTEAIMGLQTLSLQDNQLEVFRAVYPNLKTLHMERNNLTDIPAAVFIHSNLRELYLKGNPLEAPLFTEDEVDFLEALEVFDLNNGDFSVYPLTCCVKKQKTVHNLTVCVSDTSDDDDSDDSKSSGDSEDASADNESSVTAVVVGSVGGAVLLVILVIAGAWLYVVRSGRFQRQRGRRAVGLDDDEDDRGRTKWFVRDSLFGGGVSPPLGARPGSSPPPIAFQSPAKNHQYAYDDDPERSYSDRLSTRSTHSNNSSGVYSVWSDPDLLSLQVRFEDIEDIGTIGSGAYGMVYLVRYRQTQLLASKRLRVDQVTKERTQDFVEEIKMVAGLDHPNIVRFIGAAWTIESNLQALFEYMENGDLRDYLQGPSSPRHWSQEKLKLAMDVAEALVYVHSFTPPLLHRDLKSRNVLLDGQMRAKLTDFGAARYRSFNDTMTAGVGTGRWLAPEVIQGQSDYDQSADIFSLGVVLAEMDTHAIPYDHVRGANGHKLADIAILQLVATGQLRPTFGASCPPELRSLALRCMAQEPNDRPAAHVVAYELRLLQRTMFAEL